MSASPAAPDIAPVSAVVQRCSCHAGVSTPRRATPASTKDRPGHSKDNFVPRGRRRLLPQLLMARPCGPARSPCMARMPRWAPAAGCGVPGSRAGRLVPRSAQGVETSVTGKGRPNGQGMHPCRSRPEPVTADALGLWPAAGPGTGCCRMRSPWQSSRPTGGMTDEVRPWGVPFQGPSRNKVRTVPAGTAGGWSYRGKASGTGSRNDIPARPRGYGARCCCCRSDREPASAFSGGYFCCS